MVKRLFSIIGLVLGSVILWSASCLALMEGDLDRYPPTPEMIHDHWVKFFQGWTVPLWIFGVLTLLALYVASWRMRIPPGKLKFFTGLGAVYLRTWNAVAICLLVITLFSTLSYVSDDIYAAFFPTQAMLAATIVVIGGLIKSVIEHPNAAEPAPSPQG